MCCVRIVLSSLLLLPALAATAAEERSPHRSTVSGTPDSLPRSYVPPLVSNGNLSMLIDYEGGQSQRTYAGNMTPSIWWAGRRYGPPHDQLVPFGHFEQVLSCGGQTLKAPARWAQSLDTHDAVVICRADYADALTVESTVFVPLGEDIVVIRKRLLPAKPLATPVRIELKYDFSAPGPKRLAPKRSTIAPRWNAKTASLDVDYQIDGYRMYDGVLSILCDRTATPHIDQASRTFSLATEVPLAAGKPADVTFFLTFADTFDGKGHHARSARLRQLVRTEGFAGLLSGHQRQWAAFWDESSVRVPGERLEKAYYAALYDLRCNATRWSFPVGIFNTHWAGRYFGWDEVFCFLGLASSNHLSISRRAPEFRYAGLRKALDRTSRYFNNTESFGARYPWEALEDGAEAAPPGFWNDHVFHMSHIALAAWTQYLYSGDREYLKATGYPVIKECATFFVKQMIYRDSNGSMFFGKCTDLERLGPARQNPFMTSCGAIFTLDAAAKAASVLGVDQDQVGPWRTTAAKLKESLPHENGRYVPYAGCPDASIAVMGGLFPYPVFDASNAMQKNAAYEFLKNGSRYGNMYPVGNSICGWYAGWMAAALAALGDRTEPARLLSLAAEGTGCFNEPFEINEEKVAMHPWFSTTAGNYVYALNQTLLQCRDERIAIAPAVPEAWKDFSFKLPCYGNLLAEVAVKQGRIVRLALLPGEPGKPLTRTLLVPERLVDREAIRKTGVASMATEGGNLRLDLQFKGPLVLLDK